jgi:hypothetical protein
MLVSDAAVRSTTWEVLADPNASTLIFAFWATSRPLSARELSSQSVLDRDSVQATLELLVSEEVLLPCTEGQRFALDISGLARLIARIRVLVDAPVCDGR